MWIQNINVKCMYISLILIIKTYFEYQLIKEIRRHGKYSLFSDICPSIALPEKMWKKYVNVIGFFGDLNNLTYVPSNIIKACSL